MPTRGSNNNRPLNARSHAHSNSMSNCKNNEAIHHGGDKEHHDLMEDCRQPPVKNFNSFGSIRRQLGRRKKVLQQEKEQRELMEQPLDDSTEEVAHELGKPFLSSFTRSHLRNIRNKWKVEESETIVFGRGENVEPSKIDETAREKKALSSTNNTNSKRWKKKQEKKRWISRVKSRALTLSGKPLAGRNGASTGNKKKKTKNKVKLGNRTKLELEVEGPNTERSTSLQHQMAQRLKHDCSILPIDPPISPQSHEEEHDASSADPVVVGLEEELLREATNDFIPSLVYPQGIRPSGDKDVVQPKAHHQTAYTPYCYSSDDDSSRPLLRQHSQRPSAEKVVVRAVGLATASYHGDFSEDSSIGSMPSVVVRMSEVSSSRHSRDSSGFAGLMSQPSESSEDEKDKSKIRIGRTIVGILDSDAQSASSIESSMDSIPSLLKESIAPCDILGIEGGKDGKEDSMECMLSLFKDNMANCDILHPNREDDTIDSSVQPASGNEGASSRVLGPNSGKSDRNEMEESASDAHHLSVSFDSTPSPISSKQQRQADHFQPQHVLNESPPPSPIQPTILEVHSFDGACGDHIDDIPVEENKKRSIFRKLLSCGGDMKTLIPSKSKAFSTKASRFKRSIKQKIKGKNSVEENENASASPTNFSFITTSSPSGTACTTSPTPTTQGSLPSSERSVASRDKNTTPKSDRIEELKQDPFSTPKSNKFRKPFDYRRPSPTGTKEPTARRIAPVSLILDSFEKLTKKKNPRRTRKLKKIMSKLQGRKLPMLIAIGLAALCQSILANLDATNSLSLLCGSFSPLVSNGFTLDAIGMTSLAQSMIAQG
ncbi:MAG: hypothetical protein SGBAC_007257 [Bacillariaceae sp.]